MTENGTFKAKDLVHCILSCLMSSYVKEYVVISNRGNLSHMGINTNGGIVFPALLTSEAKSNVSPSHAA